MNEWIEIQPKEGWASFTRAEELSDALWKGVSEHEGKWHYTNLFAGNSVWESSSDGSAIWMCYADGADGNPGNGSLIELKINAGAAVEYAAPILRRFGLAVPTK